MDASLTEKIRGFTVKGKQDSEIVEFLEETLAWQFQPSKYTELPTPKDKYIERREDSFRELSNYVLNTYIIRDHFDMDHSARRVFKRELGKVNPKLQTWISEHSKLRGNMILSRAIISMDNIMSRLERRYPDVYEALKEVFNEELRSVIGRYNDLSFEEKVDYVRKVDDAGYKFLEILSK